jgi:calcineurin-like phosphoesterase family protein
MYEKPFLRADGTRLRPWSSASEADDAMVERWNSVVKPTDKVYCLGDVAIPRSGLKRLEELNGDKVLVAGNHDSAYEKDLRKYFRSIRGYWMLENFVLSHVPIHPCSLRNHQGNIHGHLHYQSVLQSDDTTDPKYLCVCVEHTDYTPINWQEVKARFRAQQPTSDLTAVQ